MSRRALVPLAHGCEELEAVTVIDLLRRAGIEVVAAGLAPGVVQASRGVSLNPDTALDAVAEERFDLVALPGGAAGAERLEGDARVLELLQRHYAAGAWIGAVCAAPRVLAGAGLLAGRRATAFPGHLEAHGVEPAAEPVVVDGPIVTSRGPGTAMDFALRLIVLLCGEDKAAEVESGLQRPPAHRAF
ncbi:DJ-1 family glyoxalase III [Halorhodospira neutriphila]|uniref:DJ-1 family protein n=1 Tax=Halorhodospira neutriphila TaxID=168379 RepID=A0ABS1E4Y6_9GAMM|nr:DJ-1 family glyoxalase III [Halorhodospira neutriphila]MBK1726207.1 DJ-1 family protein [Halorhodospira neutriphila]